MKRAKSALKGRHIRKAIIYFLICCLVFNTSLPVLLATPVGGAPDLTAGGGASITYGTGTYGNTTLVNVDSTRTVIHWDSLNTKGGAADVRETLAFTQDTLTGTLSNSAVLNRISGPETQFNGDLIAPDMRIFMINPAGIIFGEGSTVNATQLVASGLNMSDDAFNNFLDDASNQMVFSEGEGNIDSRGTINANSVILVGKKVLSTGSIVANEGLVVMAAGDNVYLAQDGSEVLVELLENPLDTTVDVLNSSTINNKGGTIILAAGDTFSRAVSNIGVLAAAGGDVTMQAAKVENDGQIDVSGTTNGGNVNLAGLEEVILTSSSSIEANAGTDGDGGNVTIQTDGLFRLDENQSISAKGGSESGKGGTVTITSNDFEILGDIMLSPGNINEEPGMLVINTPNVTIADGTNAGLTDTLYEADIEALSQGATNLIVNAQDGITVQDITDNEITGRYGSIELHATSDDSAIMFDDNTDTIRTTLGDIVIEAGGGGMVIGNLTTGKDISNDKPTPGQIILTTNNEGDMTTGDLKVRSGWGLAKIDVQSSGNLTVNGDVIVGSGAYIQNVPNGDNAHALVSLNAADNLELNGNVGAYSQGINDGITEGDVTTSEIRILAGTDQDLTGDAFINGDIIAKAQSSSEGTADAVVEVDAFGNITFAEGAQAYAVVNNGVVKAGPGTESEENTSPDGDHAQIIVNAQLYPTPPLIAGADEYSTLKGDTISIDVLANDTQADEPLKDGIIYSYTEPDVGTLTPTRNGDKIIGFTYTPPEDLSTLTFNENGEATVNFTYVAKVVVEEEVLLSEETTVTITLLNNLPVAVNDVVTALINRPADFNVLINDTDEDLGDVLTAINGSVAPENGTLVLNEDNTFTYTPNKDFIGEDSFTYAITDGANTSAEVEVKIIVNQITLPYITPAPGLDKTGKIDVEISGCPALAKWVAKELGIDEKMVNHHLANSIAPTRDIQPYETYSKLRNTALILQDDSGIYLSALAQVINEFASSTAPLSEEQMVTIVNVIRNNTDKGSYYALADKYLDALVIYTSILNKEMGFSNMEAVQLVTNKYISRLAQTQNIGIATFLTTCLDALVG